MTERNSSPPERLPAEGSWLNRLLALRRRLQRHARWIGRFLTLAAVAYAAFLFVRNWEQIKSIAWSNYLLAVAASLLVYLLSLLLQLVVWLRLLSYHHGVGWRDVQIYMRTVMLRQLPGGVWHWAGRSTLYEAETAVSAKTVLLANLLDWCLLIVMAFGVYGLFAVRLPWWGRMLLVGFNAGMVVFLARSWLPDNGRWRELIREAMIWTAVYVGSWVAGGLILYLLVIVSEPQPVPTWRNVVAIWALAGGVSALLIIAPSGLGVREVSLTLLLQAHVPVSVAVLIAVILRLTFTAADLIWGAAGWGISQLITRSAVPLPEADTPP